MAHGDSEKETKTVYLPAAGIFAWYTAEFDVLTQLTRIQADKRHALRHAQKAASGEQMRSAGARPGLPCWENVTESHQCRRHFRSAAALGMDAVLLTQGCSNPLYRRSHPGEYGNGVFRFRGHFWILPERTDAGLPERSGNWGSEALLWR